MQITITSMRYDQLKAEGAALRAGRPFTVIMPTYRVRYFTRHPDANAHVKVWRDHKINATLDYFINTHSLAARELAGGPL